MAPSQMTLRSAQEDELDRRLASLDQDRREGVTSAEVKLNGTALSVVYSVIFTRAARAEMIGAQGCV